jgi:formylglycine-generating enzyme required for sulfatase activity
MNVYQFIVLLVLVSFVFGCTDNNSTDSKTTTSFNQTEMVMIPVGEFIMGSDKVDDAGLQQRYGFVKPLFLDEHPLRKVYLDAYYIDKYEVTNGQYKKFVHTTKRPEPALWIQNGYNVFPEKLKAMSVDMLRIVATEYFKLDLDTTTMKKQKLLQAILKKQKFMDNLPVTGVTWYDASAYCRWVNKRLPTEAEWEKAARGPGGLEFPWGNKWDPNVANTGDTGDWDEGIAPVGSYQMSQSPYGVYDMAGNVWEWVYDWYKPYPGTDYESDAFGEKNKVIRGGGGGIGHYSMSIFFRGASRQYAKPDATSADVGFRCARP